MASIQRIVSPLTKDASYRAQVRVKDRSSESATFPNRKDAEAWAASIETAIREGRHFPHAAAKRTSFDAPANDYAETVLVEFGEVQRAARTLQLNSLYPPSAATLALALAGNDALKPNGALEAVEPSRPQVAAARSTA